VPFSDYPDIRFASHSSEPVVEDFPHEFPFDPTYGHTFDDLIAVEPPDNAPEDFEAFWRDLHQRARAVPVELERRPDGETESGHRRELLTYTSLGGVRVGGWLLTPADESAVKSVAVIGTGYGGRQGADVTAGLEEHTAMLLPCPRGLPDLSVDAVPGVTVLPHHVLSGLEDKDRYVIGGCVGDHIVALTILLELFPHAAGRAAYWGNSFGGGIGALYVPWEERLKCAALGQPTFGHQPYRVTVPCNGSGSHVKRAHDKDPGVMETLRYYDAATAAKHIRVPTLVVPSMFDPVVPPMGQFAVYKAIPDELKTLHCMKLGHFALPVEAEEMDKRSASMRTFFAEYL